MPNCEICGKELEMITHTHLKRHDLGVDEYKKRFPMAGLSSKKFRNAVSEATKGKEKPRSEAHQRNLTESIRRGFKGKKLPPAWNKGKKMPEFSGDKNPAKRPEVRKKISNALKGRKITWGKKLSKSIREGYRNGKTTWNKRLTKETDERVAKYAKSLVGHRPTYPKTYYVPELGHKVRSSYENEVGLILKRAGIPYDYEGKVYKFDGTSYRPDFPITDRLIVEAKGYFTDWQREKYKKFREAYPEITLIIVGGAEGEDLSEYCNIHIPWENREKMVGAILSEL